MLVPFLAVYVSYGLLEADLDRFLNEAAFAEFNRFSLSRTSTTTTPAGSASTPLQVVAI